MSVKYQEIVDALDGLLREGEQLVVSQVEGEVHVREMIEDEDAVVSALRDSDPELYGYLIVVNDRISNATGCLWPTALLLATLAACGAVAQFRPDLAFWWVYAIIVVIAGVLWILGNEWREQVVYLQTRDELFSRLTRANLSRDRLLALVASDTQLSNLTSKLKGDTAADGI